MIIALLAAVPAVAAYAWPNPRMDALESLRYDQGGPAGSILSAFVIPCNQFIHDTAGPSGRTNAADWLRTAYHDMATYDHATGTGGLDASIQFSVEQQRAENLGDSFTNTVQIVKPGTSRYVSLADGLALAALYAVEACGGPKLDFRGGRVDALSAGPTGVPEPQSTLQSHRDAFARMGFTPTEMIELVACGHTIGGVQSKFFPTIVPNSTVTDNNPDGNAPFDSSSTLFDNHIATDYISGKTNNPLVVGANITTRSDARIFSSDGNATMKAFAHSPGLFNSTCASVLSRMLDTVPRTVNLTEVIEPMPVKPDSISLVSLKNGSFSLSGYVRFWNLDPKGNASVSLLWADQSGQPCKGCIVPLSPRQRFLISTTFVDNHVALWYSLPTSGALINSTKGISRFWFSVTQHGKTWAEDQGGLGFPLQTSVLAADTSCVVLTGTDNILRMDIAVQKQLQPSLVYLFGNAYEDLGAIIPGTTSSWPAVFNKKASAKNAAYNIYSVAVSSSSTLFSTVNVGATINGKNITDWTALTPGDALLECA